MARTKIAPERKDVAKAEKGSDVPKKRRWKPGTQALREIRRYQRSTELMLPKSAFSRVAREVAADVALGGAIRFQSSALDAIQQASEDFLTDIYKKAQTYALHGKRITISKDDLQLAVADITKVDA